MEWARVQVSLRVNDVVCDRIIEVPAFFIGQQVYLTMKVAKCWRCDSDTDTNGKCLGECS